MNDTTRRLMMGAAGAGEKIYVEDVFSTYLYTGNGSTQTITNGIDLSGKGGLVWAKDRTNAENNVLIDTARGGSQLLYSNTTAAQSTPSAPLTFTSTGYSISGNGAGNTSPDNYASWTFRKQAKFFDVVTWTGDGNQNRQIPHDLGCIPGAIFCKQLNGNSNWRGFHIGSGITSSNLGLSLNLTSAFNFVGIDNSSRFSSTMFKPFELYDTSYNRSNEPGETYVAYLFAHDAGGFGDTGNESIIKCGSYTGNGADPGPTITLGWEPQWLLIKNATYAPGSNWNLLDNMRGITMGADEVLTANSSGAAITVGSYVNLTATGFQLAGANQPGNENWNRNGDTYIYIAIRRGPMKTPTDATKVFEASSGTYSTLGTGGFAPDMMILKGANSNSGATALAGQIADRLRGFNEGWSASYNGAIAASSNSPYLVPTSTSAESTTNSRIGSVPSTFSSGSKYIIAVVTGWPESAYDYAAKGSAYTFRRAPGFFDVVAYSGTGVARTLNHNLNVVPELMIVKRRDGGSNWRVYVSVLGATKTLLLNTTDSQGTESDVWNDTSPTASVFSVGTGTSVNASAGTYVNYLFASVSGVSKVGSYTGTGTTLSIDCGFTNGARFVLIKRTDMSGDWYVWDTARGIIAANDPYLLLNSTAAEVTNTDYIDPLNSGFQISSTAPAAINANGGSFIYLAIA